MEHRTYTSRQAQLDRNCKFHKGTGSSCWHGFSYSRRRLYLFKRDGKRLSKSCGDFNTNRGGKKASVEKLVHSACKCIHDYLFPYFYQQAYSQPARGCPASGASLHSVKTLKWLSDLRSRTRTLYYHDTLRRRLKLSNSLWQVLSL